VLGCDGGVENCSGGCIVDCVSQIHGMYFVVVVVVVRFCDLGSRTFIKAMFSGILDLLSHADVDVDNFKRWCTSYTFLVEYRVLIDLILHRSSINNSARLSNKFGGFYFIFKFGISGLLHQVITTIADRIRATSKFENLLKIGMLVWGEADSETSPKRSLRRKLFKTCCMNWEEVSPTHAYYNGSCTSKDSEDPSWSTSFKTRRTQKTSSVLEALWKTLFVLYLYLIGTL
ncbi:hypothetical protein Tco_0479517, partial [Tanacetum coccineum]